MYGENNMSKKMALTTISLLVITGYQKFSKIIALSYKGERNLGVLKLIKKLYQNIKRA